MAKRLKFSAKKVLEHDFTRVILSYRGVVAALIGLPTMAYINQFHKIGVGVDFIEMTQIGNFGLKVWVTLVFCYFTVFASTRVGQAAFSMIPSIHLDRRRVRYVNSKEISDPRSLLRYDKKIEQLRYAKLNNSNRAELLPIAVFTLILFWFVVWKLSFERFAVTSVWILVAYFAVLSVKSSLANWREISLKLSGRSRYFSSNLSRQERVGFEATFRTDRKEQLNSMSIPEKIEDFLSFTFSKKTDDDPRNFSLEDQEWRGFLVVAAGVLALNFGSAIAEYKEENSIYEFTIVDKLNCGILVEVLSNGFLFLDEGNAEFVPNASLGYVKGVAACS